MLYIVALIKVTEDKVTSYRVIDTCSESTMLIGPNTLAHIILNTNIQVVNASILNDNILLKDWVNQLYTFTSTKSSNRCSGAEYVLLASRYDNKFKIVNNTGYIEYIEEKDLKQLAKLNNIANCNTNLDKIDTYRIYQNITFEKLIESKYNRFKAKTSLLGIGGITFDYEIENYDVRLIKYTGENKHVMLPSFITSIVNSAFSNSDILSLKLNRGLKIIGEGAFASNADFGRLERVTIPESVELIAADAFTQNPRLFKSYDILNTDRFKLLNPKTIMLEQFEEQ